MRNLKHYEIEMLSAHVCIRTLKTENIHDAYISGLNDPTINYYLDNVARNHQTKASVKEFVQQSFDNEKEILFGLWQSDVDKHCGTVRLHGIDDYHKTALIGVCIFDSSVWGKGVATEAIRLVTRWGLQDLGLRWIEAGVYEENVGSSMVFERSGYSLKYSLIDKYLLNGQPTTTRIYAATSEDYV